MHIRPSDSLYKPGDGIPEDKQTPGNRCRLQKYQYRINAAVTEEQAAFLEYLATEHGSVAATLRLMIDQARTLMGMNN